jgi:hypothetical protein
MVIAHQTFGDMLRFRAARNCTHHRIKGR